MCRSKVLVVLDMHLTLRNFLEGNINHQTKHDAKHQTSNMERSYKTLFQVAFIFTKVIHRRRLTGPLIRP